MKHRRIIKLVAVGNEPFLQENRAEAMPYILNAFNRIVKLVADNGLANEIKVNLVFLISKHSYFYAKKVFFNWSTKYLKVRLD